MSVLMIEIKHIPNVERIDQWHNELGAILSKLAHEISRTGVPLVEVVTDRSGIVVGTVEYGQDAFAGVRKTA
jgi:hypothetical protein